MFLMKLMARCFREKHAISIGYTTWEMEKWQFSNNQSYFVNTDSQFETPYHIKVPRAVNYPVLWPIQQCLIVFNACCAICCQCSQELTHLVKNFRERFHLNVILWFHIMEKNNENNPGQGKKEKAQAKHFSCALEVKLRLFGGWSVAGSQVLNCLGSLPYFFKSPSHPLYSSPQLGQGHSSLRTWRRGMFSLL